ncbi:unnamed protein product [Protopolystoma xenopodis]|uniref:Uncharacterized protein n=1 Tax=Protopolystoma xenopodis TaxID=117903 RepID=A0A3S5BG60_9PLAT|nr:unnamed protein product [Protopolystoma xenopodis]
MILAGRHRLRRVAPLTRPPAQSAASPEDEEEEEDETRTEVTPSLRMRISDSTQSRLMLEPSLLDPRQLPNPVVSGELVKEFMLPQQQKKKQQYLQHSLPAQMPLISVADGSEVSPSTSTPSPPSLPQQQSASMLGLRTATTPTNASYEQINCEPFFSKRETLWLHFLASINIIGHSHFA